MIFGYITAFDFPYINTTTKSNVSELMISFAPLMRGLAVYLLNWTYSSASSETCSQSARALVLSLYDAEYCDRNTDRPPQSARM
jgi:hypothetical protein